MTNAFNCPDNIYAMMNELEPNPLLQAIRWLGPERVQWTGKEVGPKYATSGPSRTPVCWALDGKPATEGSIFKAAETAGLNPKASAAGCRDRTGIVSDALWSRPPSHEGEVRMVSTDSCEPLLKRREGEKQ